MSNMSNISNISNISEEKGEEKTSKINGMFLNQNNVLKFFIQTLIALATDKGYRIYETYNFILLSEVDDYQDFIVITL